MRLIRLLMQWLWLAPVILLIIILVLALRSRKEFTRWWGLPILVGGFLVLLPALLYRSLITMYLSAWPLSEVPELVKDEALRVLIKLAGYIFQPMLIQAVVIVVVGILLVILLSLGSKRKTQST